MSAGTGELEALKQGKLAGATRLQLRGGLSEFPREIFDLADTLEVLDLTGNALSRLPEDLPRLRKLGVLFCSSNAFEELPEVLGSCPALSMVGFRANKISRVPGAALPRDLRWLILTENEIEELPAELGNCAALQKLMLSGNRLTTLPETMAQCERLEMVRMAANRFSELPAWLLELPCLAWLALAGNPMCPIPTDLHAPSEIPWSELRLEEKLGEGASGVISRAAWLRDGNTDADVAVKVFKTAVTSDGLPENEIAACLAAGSHAHLPGVIGQVSGHPEGAQALVMPLLGAGSRALAGPPSFASCTRDVYAEECRFTVEEVRRIATGVGNAVAHLHRCGLMHGDLYAHNVLRDDAGHVVLSDLGAACFLRSLDSRTAAALERVEMRAFHVMVEELLERCAGDETEVEALRRSFGSRG